MSAVVLALVVALAAQASTLRHPTGAIKLSASSLTRSIGVLCGKVHGVWVSGELLPGGYFLSDVQRAHNYGALARGTRGASRASDLARARSFTRRAKARHSICTRAGTKIESERTPSGTSGAVPSGTSGAAPSGTSGAATAGAVGGAGAQTSSPATQGAPPATPGIYISPQFFGHHLMNQWGLTPPFPVHAMRLWDSDTKWCQIDSGTGPGDYDFGQLDALLGQASRLGADVEFTFGGTPQWAANGSYPQSSTTNQCSFPATAAPPASESYWTNYITALVSNAKGKIHAYELWNEANDPNSWSGSMAQLVQMSVDAASIIHRIDPSALVLSPSVSADATGYTFLQQYLAALPAGTIDGIAVHSYTDGAWPENTVPRELQSVRAALPAAFANLPIWSTEGAWGQNSQFSSSATLQSAFVARYDLMLLTNGVARSYWYAYQNSQWGTLWDGSALTAAGVATATLQNWLTGATFTGCSGADGNLWTCNLTTSAGEHAQIVWATTWAVWYPTTGYSTVKTLAGASSASNGWIQAGTEPVLLSS